MSIEIYPQYRLDVAFSSAVVPVDKSRPVLVASYGWAEKLCEGEAPWTPKGQGELTVEPGVPVFCRVFDLSLSMPEQRSLATEVRLCFGDNGPFTGDPNPRFRLPIFRIGRIESEALNLASEVGAYTFESLNVKSPAPGLAQRFWFTIGITTAQNATFEVDPEMIVGGPGPGFCPGDDGK